MCGIVGYSGSFSSASLSRANGLQSHRGADDSGEFFDAANGIALAHRRLSILDVSPLGHQPMTAENGQLAVTFNGEIYNFRELRAELEAKGHRFRGHSDTEVLLRLYAVEGETMLTRLNGIFAFALWDKGCRSLLLARDALGVKPLYFSEAPEGFAFASELKALLQFLSVSELDIHALHRYLSFLWCPGDGTPLSRVRKVSPGEALIVQAGSIVRRWRWYQLPTFSGAKDYLSEDDAILGTRESLRQAVKRQLVADVPVGAFLSGGLDSSAIVAFAREQVPDIRCFTIEAIGGEEGGTTQDLPYARRVAKHLQVPLEIVQIDATRMADDLQRMVVQLDEPLADPAALNVLYISKLARSYDVKVLLSGAGGDDLFSGYRRHWALRHEFFWNWLPLSLRCGIASIAGRLDQRNAVLRRFTKTFAGVGLSGDAKLIHYFKWGREADVLALYAPEVRDVLMKESVGEPMLEFLKKLPASAEPLEKMLALEQRFFLADHNLIYTDKMSMAAGVEVRVPFLDLDLVTHAARVPALFKQRGHVGKWVLKKAMEPYLPRDIIYRPKTGFGAPLRRWMRGELRPLMNELLSTDSLKRRGLFDPRAVHQLIARNDSGRVDASYTLLSLLSIEIWCRAYVDAVY